MSPGPLDFGLDHLFQAFALEVPLATLLGLALLLLILCLPFGLVLEWRGRKAREAQSRVEY